MRRHSNMLITIAAALSLPYQDASEHLRAPYESGVESNTIQTADWSVSSRKLKILNIFRRKIKNDEEGSLPTMDAISAVVDLEDDAATVASLSDTRPELDVSDETPPQSPPEMENGDEFQCFVDGNELRLAVRAYLRNSNRGTAVAEKYGWPIGTWCTRDVQDFDELFDGGTDPRAQYFNEDISAWNTRSATSFHDTFHKAYSFNQDLSRWNVGRVTSMQGMFWEAVHFNQDLNAWDTSKVTDMENLFRGALSFNGNVSKWDTSSVINMEDLFRDAYLFNGDVSLWDTSSADNMKGVFDSAISFNQDLSNWDTGSATEMNFMFYAASKFNSNIKSWDVSKVVSMRGMFQYAYNFRANLSNWKVAECQDMRGMFDRATRFNSDLSRWDVRKVTTFENMFRSAKSLDQDLCEWRPLINTTLADLSKMFEGSACPMQKDPFVWRRSIRGSMCQRCGLF